MAPPLGNWVVACLCAEWCRSCREYRACFESFRPREGAVRLAWIDIESNDRILEDIDVDGLPTLLVGNGTEVVFAGPVIPRIEILQGLVARAMRLELPPLRDEKTVQWATRLLTRIVNS